jgi:hypothetical protein
MTSSRFTVVLLTLLCLCAVVSFAQAGDGAIALNAVRNGSTDAGARAPVNAAGVQNGSPNSIVFDADTGAVISGGFNASLNTSANTSSAPQVGNDDFFFIDNRRPNRPTIAGLNTLATFDGAFFAQAGPNSHGGKLFRWTMVGNDPRQGGTTVIPFSSVTVDLQLLNADGSVFMTVPFAPFQTRTLESPNFEPLNYRSGYQIEYADAVHRAQFFHIMRQDWHTLLIPTVKDHVTIAVPQFVNVQLANGNIVQVRSYFTGTATDGQTFVLMFNSLFNFFFDNLVVSEINGGNFTPNAINATLFPNTFLFSLGPDPLNHPGNCCTLGFHTYFFDPPTVPQDRWIVQYASWISPGLFTNPNVLDVLALSHETAEIFGDPFVDNATPSWQFPGQPANSKDCQANLEEGDPIEVLPNLAFPITVTEGRFKFTYHPQNIPLLQWFEMGSTSDAIDGAFSFPDETVLTKSAIPCPQ